MKQVLLAASALCLVSAAAAAADLPVRKGPPTVAAPYNWSGLYIGGVIGAGIVTPQFVDYDENFSYGNWHAGDWAFTGGGTVGYNWQWGAAVFGIEGDFNWTSYKESLFNSSWESQLDAKWNWFATVRARFGLAVDRVLAYATVGVAFVDQDYKVFYPSNGCGPTTADDCAKLNKTEVGLAAGVGAEYALANNWSFKAEYLYIKLPTKTFSDSFDPSSDLQYQFTTDAHFARIGLNYRFGGGY